MYTKKLTDCYALCKLKVSNSYMLNLCVFVFLFLPQSESGWTQWILYL